LSALLRGKSEKKLIVGWSEILTLWLSASAKVSDISTLPRGAAAKTFPFSKTKKKQQHLSRNFYE